MNTTANVTALYAAPCITTAVVDAASLLVAPFPSPSALLLTAPVALDNLASLHSFYIHSHSVPVNWAIHAAAVPILKVSILLLLAVATAARGATGKTIKTAATSLPSLPSQYAHLFSTDAGLAIAAAYVAYYTTLSPSVGTFAMAVFGAEWLTARLVLAAVGRRRAIMVGAVGVVATEAAMIVGHHAWEGTPQAIVAGPAAAIAAAPLCMQLDVAIWAGWLPRVAALLAAGT
ncbi:hypothetical protein MMPV_006653 [Pyropia vietnamensis]